MVFSESGDRFWPNHNHDFSSYRGVLLWHNSNVSYFCCVLKLLTFGVWYSHVLVRAPHYPSEDEKLRASRISRRRGGNCPNTLEVLGQLLQYRPSSAESSLNLITILPSKTSLASQQIQSSLGDIVRLDSCIYRERFSEPASSYIIMSQATGSRTIVNYNELPEMTRIEFATTIEPLRAVTDRPWFHFEVR